jgi:hypothetical protein
MPLSALLSPGSSLVEGIERGLGILKRSPSFRLDGSRILRDQKDSRVIELLYAHGGNGMGKYDNISTLGLISRFIQLIKRFANQEKLYLKQVVEGSLKMSLPGVVLAVAGLVFLALSGIFCLVTLVLVLNIWFAPWASALIVTAFLMLSGLILALIGLLMVKRGVAAARTNLDQVKEDLKWLKKS